MTMQELLKKHGIARPRCGAEVGPGWFKLLDALMTALVAMGWDKDCAQIKEKFGGLRFYTGALTEQMQEVVDAFEARSFEVCEECGKWGEPREGGWVRTLCDEHAEKRA